MLELWIPVTIAAAFFQNLRSAMQKHLKARLSTTGATFVRFSYAFPAAIAYVAALHLVFGLTLPSPNANFLMWCVLGGVTQILATALLVHLFSFRNFAVGTAYSKTEPVQAAIFGIILLGDTLTVGAVIAILIGLVGVMTMSVARTTVTARTLVTSMVERTALIGIASGAFFGISAVAYRAASLSLEEGEVLIRAGYTLAWVTVMQTIGMSIYLRLREPGQITATLQAWKPASLVGLSGMIASACWFTAMTVQNVAYVRALGQIELVFTFIASTLIFREKSTRLEIVGIVLIVTGIVTLLLGT